MITTVVNLATQQKQTYTCSPREAVLAAYAQSMNDWCTWQYEERYGSLVLEGRYSYCCGDFAALKDQTGA